MSPATPLRAVLFDMDGLLIDSEPVWFEVEGEVFTRLGATRAWTHDDARDLRGNTLAASAAQMVRRGAGTVDAATAAGWLVDGMAAHLRSHTPFKPGARDLLAALARQSVPTALVSSSYRRLVDTVLDALPPATFTVSVAGDEVTRGKPHPEPYQRALDALGVPAQAAVVLEDSSPGARAGAAAGCAVVVVPDLAVLPDEHSWHVGHSLGELSVATLASLVSA